MKARLIAVFLSILFLRASSSLVQAASIGIGDDGIIPSRLDLAAPDPDQESGFPIPAYYFTGSITYWPESPSFIVGNFDNDNKLEMAEGVLGNSSLYVWNSNTSLQRGWPAKNNDFLAFPAAGNLKGNGDKLEIVSAFDEAKVTAYDEFGNPLPGWPRSINGWGHTAPALADVNRDGYEEIFVDLDDGYLYGFQVDGTSLPGWPVRGCNPSQSLHTPAIADIDGDGNLEIVVVTDPSLSSGICAFHPDGSTVAGFPVYYDGYATEFPVIGDVDGDHHLEIMVVTPSSYNHFALKIFSSSGTVKHSIELAGNVGYVAYKALADINLDGMPEILVSPDSTEMGANDTYVYAVKGTGEVLPGWPVTLTLPSGYSGGGSQLVLAGDINGDQKPEVLASRINTYAFDANGHILPKFPKSGSALAIADIDQDGRNEVITTVEPESNVNRSSFPDTVNAYDLGGSNYGPVEWGQFGGGPEHRGLYPVPTAPSPPIHTQRAIYIPVVMKPFDSSKEKAGMSGLVTYQNKPESNVPIELRLFDGTNWSTISTQSTDGNGRYYFPNISSLTAGQAYNIRYLNHAAGHLASYSSRVITNYKAGSEVVITDFDITDLSLEQPPNGANVTIPYSFSGNDRTSLPPDRYSFTLYDPKTDYLFESPIPYENAGTNLTNFPPGLSTGKAYLWTFVAVSPEGAIGVPAESRQVTFSDTGAEPEQ